MTKTRLLQFLCAAVLAVTAAQSGTGTGPTGVGIWVLPSIVDPSSVDVDSEGFTLVPLDAKLVDASDNVEVVLPPQLSNADGTRYSSGENPQDIPVLGRIAYLSKEELEAMVLDGNTELLVVFKRDGLMAIGRLDILASDPENSTGENF